MRGKEEEISEAWNKLRLYKLDFTSMHDLR